MSQDESALLPSCCHCRAERLQLLLLLSLRTSSPLHMQA